MSSRPRDATVRNRVLKRDTRCVKCGRPGPLEVAHKVGLWAGGADTIDNAIALCSICHRYQPDDGNDVELQQYLADRLDPIQRFTVNILCAALKAIKEGANPETLPNSLERVFELANEFPLSEMAIPLWKLMCELSGEQPAPTVTQTMLRKGTRTDWKLPAVLAALRDYPTKGDSEIAALVSKFDDTVSRQFVWKTRKRLDAGDSKP